MPVKPREFSKAEWQQRRERRARGELPEPPESKEPLAPVDSNRKRVRTYVTMDPQARVIAKKIGNGVVSRGIDRALFHFADCADRTTPRPKKKTKSRYLPIGG
jgi:hypothetical protein